MKWTEKQAGRAETLFQVGMAALVLGVALFFTFRTNVFRPKAGAQQNNPVPSMGAVAGLPGSMARLGVNGRPDANPITPMFVPPKFIPPKPSSELETALSLLSSFEKRLWAIWVIDWSEEHEELEKRLGRPTGNTQVIVLREFLQMRDEESERRGEKINLRPILIQDAKNRSEEHLLNMQTIAGTKESESWNVRGVNRWRTVTSKLRLEPSAP